MKNIKNILYLLFISIIVIGTISLSSANDFDLQQAINNAPNGVLDLTSQHVVYINQKIIINKPITIKSNSNSYIVSRDSNLHDSFSIETTGSVIFSNLSFYNFDKAVNLNPNSNVKFTNCLFSGGKTSIYSSGNSEINVEHSTFSNNDLLPTIVLLKGSNLNIDGSTFTDNSAYSSLYDGGSCINSVDSNIHINGTTFRGNNAHSGGVIYFNNKDSATNLDIRNSFANSNGADMAGGFLYTTGSQRYTVTANGNTFNYNHINVNDNDSSPIYNCGGVFFSTSRVTTNYEFNIVNNNFNDNSAAIGFIASGFGYNTGGKYNLDSNLYNDEVDAIVNGYKAKSSDVDFSWD